MMESRAADGTADVHEPAGGVHTSSHDTIHEGGEVHEPHESGIAVAEVTGPLFDENELAEFESDDRHAGRTLGKLLSGFFLYTVIVMTIVALWTLRTLSH